MIYLLAGLMLMLVILSKSPTFKGFIGEVSVRSKLKKLNSKEYMILNDIMLKKADGRTSQVDHIVISKYGVFVIETKNYTGWIVGNEKAEYWTQVIYKRKEKLYNPIRQNYGHIKAIEAALDDTTIPIISIIAFSTRADLKLEPMSVEVIYTTKLVSTITKYNVPVLTGSQVKHIHDILSTSTVNDRQERKQHVKVIKENLNVNRAKITSGICPRCGNQLMKRNGKNGAFVGCNSYPRCRFTSNA
ncbi:NERD domain-containing protein [Paenibacillus sp. FSL H8-0537]|uniref:NERD domain-containing protein n=1 Tax=Paenibacillus sp. FSL H8-0537 TaxID=2921399 RepID=UPI0031011EE7